MVDRLTLSNGCVSGLKEVRARTIGFVRSGSVRSMFDAIFDIRYSTRCSIVRPVWYLKKLKTLAKVGEVVTS